MAPRRATKRPEKTAEEMLPPPVRFPGLICAELELSPSAGPQQKYNSGGCIMVPGVDQILQ